MERDWYGGGNRNKSSFEEFSGGSNCRHKDLRDKLAREQDEQRQQQRAHEEEGRRRDDRYQDFRSGGSSTQIHNFLRPPCKKKGTWPLVNPQSADLSSSGASQSGTTAGDKSGENITYFNYEKQGHLQAACMGVPFCVNCKMEGHLSVMCTVARGERMELGWASMERAVVSTVSRSMSTS
jgi:hypothetical protein